MRIAFVSTILTYPWGGADSSWTSAAEVALSRGDKVLMAISSLAASHPRISTLVGKGATLVVRPAPDGLLPLWRRAWRKAPWRRSSAHLLNASIREFRPDLLIFSCGGTYDPIMEPELTDWLRASKTPYRIIANFQNEHPSLDEAERLRARDILLDANRIFCVSPRNLETTRMHLLTPLANAECIHNPLSPSSELPWAVPEPWSLACVGRLEPVKGVDLLLRALAAGLGDTPGWRLNVYGRGPQRDYLEDCARYLSISDRVSFHGFVQKLDDIWAANHLLVSSAIDEGVPMTIPEAMLRGRAVLATQVGGATEWIQQGLSGFICPAPTVNLLAGSLREAWDQRLRWREMGAVAAARARTLYRPDDYQRIVA